MKLDALYQYVYEGRAIIQLPAGLAPEKLKNITQKKHDAIRRSFSFLGDKNNDTRKQFFYLLTSLNRKQFFNLLTSLNTESANALKAILYDEEEVKMLQAQSADIRARYVLPDDAAIKEKFKELNQQYQYFDNGQSAQASNDFLTFFKAYKLIADYAEQNNDEQNTLVFENTYKMLVLFGAAHKKKQSLFANVNTYLRQHGQGDKPVHDALVQSIPVNDPPLQDLAGWRKFIQTYGAKGLEYFQEAPDIEKLLNGKAPETKKEAQQAASQLSYARANEYPKLAQLCKQYHLNKDIFNRCLEVEKKRKSNDKLPNISVNGSDAGHAGYHLVKLSIDDPRAYVLGHITNCCQSMGGHSEQCVIDGITRVNNGFYVLLKGKPAAAPLKQNGHINYKDFRIVGQGYAWLSRKGNLVFDSWENLMPAQDDKVIVPLLQKFAEKATEQETEIVRVTIGRGGKTPKEFSESSLANRPETMMEGVQYGDSREQSLVYINKDKLNQLKSALLDKWDELKSPLWQTKEAFKEWVNRYPVSSYYDSTEIEALFFNQKTEDVWQDAAIKDWVIATTPKMPELLDVLYFLYRHNLLTEDALHSLKSVKAINQFLDCLLGLPINLISAESFKLLADNAENARGITEALSALHQADPGLVNVGNLQLLAENAETSNFIGIAFSDLYRANSALASDENFKLIADNAMHALFIGRVFLRLYQNNHALASNENFKLLIKHAAHVKELSVSLIYLSNQDKALVNDKRFKLLIENVEYAEKISSEIVCLHEVNPMLVNDKRFKLLVENAKYAQNITSAFLKLYESGPNLANDENFKLLADNPANASDICSGLRALYEAHPDLVNDENRKLLAENPAYASRIGCGLRALYEAHPDLVNDENRKLLAENPEYAYPVGVVLSVLYKVHPDLVNIDNFKLLAVNLEHVWDLEGLLPALHEAYPKLLNDKNFKLLFKHAAHAEDIWRPLEVLHDVSPKLVNDMSFKLLVENAEQAEKVSAALKVIYNQCVKVSGATSNESPAFFNSNSPQSPPSLSKPLAEKIKNYLCGEREIAFNPEEIKMIKECNWGDSPKDCIPLILSLSDAAPYKRPR